MGYINYKKTRSVITDLTVENAGFESGDVSWTKETNFSIGVYGVARTGTYSARCNEVGGVSRSLLNSIHFPAAEGETFDFGCYVNTDASWAGASARCFLQFEDSAQVFISNAPGSGITTASSGWTLSSDTGVVAPAGTGYVQLLMSSIGQTAGNVYFDDAYITNDYNRLNPDFQQFKPAHQDNIIENASRDWVNVETIYLGRDKAYEVKSDIVDVSLQPQWEEFWHSVSGGETFALDATGTEAAPDNPLTVKLVPRSWRIEEIGPRHHVYSFKVRVA